MKKILGFMLLLLLGECTKEEVATPKLDLNGTFSGKVGGKTDPYYFDGQATWVITHQGNELLAEVSYQNLSVSGAGNVSDFKTPTKKLKATIVNDTTFVGEFTDLPPLYIKCVMNGKIRKNGQQIISITDASAPSYNYYRFSFDLTKK